MGDEQFLHQQLIMCISEAASKIERGRPPAFRRAFMDQARGYGIVNRHKTLRQQQTQAYALQGGACLRDEGEGFSAEFEWLVCDDPHTWRTSILAELGRLHRCEGWTADEIRDLARELCQAKPRTRNAVSRLRRLRTGEGPATSVSQIMLVAEQAVGHYAAQHPDMTPRLVADAFARLAELYGEERDDTTVPISQDKE